MAHDHSDDSFDAADHGDVAEVDPAVTEALFEADLNRLEAAGFGGES